MIVSIGWSKEQYTIKILCNLTMEKKSEHVQKFQITMVGKKKRSTKKNSTQLK